MGVRVGGLFTILTLTLLLSAFLVTQPRAEALREALIRDRANGLAEVAARLIGPMLDLDAPAPAAEAIDALMVDPAVDAIEVYDAGGRVWLARTSSATAGGNEDVAHRWVHRPVLGLGGEAVGRLVIEVNDAAFVKRRNEMLAAGGQVMAPLVALGLLLIVVVVRLTLRPLGLIAGAAERIADGYVDAPLPARSSTDEVGRVLESFRRMQTNLQLLSDAAGRIAEGDLETPTLGRGPLHDGFRRMVEGLARARAHEAKQRAELERAAAVAEAANESKSRFLARISHEMRTPLNGVLGMADLLLGDMAETDPRREDLLVLRQSASSMLHLVEGLLEFARVDAGELEVRPGPFFPAQVFAAEVARHRKRAEEKQLGFTDAGGDPDLCVVADARAIVQIVSSLVDNAIKFTEEGSVHLGWQVDVQGRTLIVEVTDTGPGIDPAAHRQVFEAFEQVDGSVTRSHGGLGLGLTLAGALCEKLGGQLQLASEVGKGTCFTLRIPLESVDRVEGAARPERRRNGQPRVLLVEDERVNQMVARRHLEALGVEVELAENGAVALERLDAQTFDLVLMDLMMPVMDGWTATRLIRERERGVGAPIPVIAVTANALPGDREKALNAGMDEHMAKPVRRPALKEALERWIGSW